MSSVLQTIETWLRATLWDDVEIRSQQQGRTLVGAYSHIAPAQGPQEASDSPPMLVWSLASGGSNGRVLCGEASDLSPAYRVQIVARDVAFPALAVWEARIEALLGNAEVAADAVFEGSPAFDSVQETPIRSVDVDAGTRVYRAGGIYRFHVCP